MAREVAGAIRSSEKTASKYFDDLSAKMWGLAQKDVIRNIFREVGVEGMAGEPSSRVELEIGVHMQLLGLTREEALAYIKMKAQTALLELSDARNAEHAD